MPVLVIGEVPNLTEEIYGAMVGQLKPLMEASPGFIAHAGGPNPAGGSRRARGVAYDPVRDRWRRLPLAPLTSPFLTAAWTGREFVAWDDARRTASFDPRSGRWGAVEGLASHDSPR